MESSDTLKELVELSRWLGEPDRDYVILGEGNTSAKVDNETFLVKASGRPLCGIDETGFVVMKAQPVLSILERDAVSDEEMKQLLSAARVETEASTRPSIETLFHAFLLGLPEVRFVGHTHPTVCNALLCANRGRELLAGSLFPDEIVYCGLSPVYVEYRDPGLPLAQAIRKAVAEFIDRRGERPRIILLENHGIIAPGRTVREVEESTEMWVKVSHILLGSQALGGPRFLTDGQAKRIATRPDEVYRMQAGGE